MSFHGRGCDCDPCWEASRPRRPDPMTLCYCCKAEDDPSGTGPAINTGFCEECGEAGCPEKQVGTRCQAVAQ